MFYLSGYPWNNQVYLHAVDSKTGKAKWECKDELQQYLLDGNQIYGAGRTNLFKREPGRLNKCFLRAYSVDTGLSNWDLPCLTDPRGVRIVGVGKYLYVIANGQLQAISRDKGTVVWRGEERILPSPEQNAVVLDGKVYAELGDRNIGVFSGDDGKLEGKILQGPIDEKLVRSLTIQSNLIVIVGADGKCEIAAPALNKRTNFESGLISSKVLLKDGSAFFGAFVPTSGAPGQLADKSGNLVCAFDVAGLRYKWKTAVEKLVISGPLVSSGKVFVGTVLAKDRKDVGNIYALNESDGKILWQSECLLPMSVDLALGNDMIFVNGGGILNAIDANTGESLWTRKLPKSEFIANPIFKDGVVYAVADDSNLYAVKAEKIQNKSGEK